MNQYYYYYHYLVDGFDDRGWGCGYRTLQTICSWINMSTETGRQRKVNVPSLTEVQEVLVKIQDKESSFVGSKSWIGTFEICLVLDSLYDIQSKIIHVKPGTLNNRETKFLQQHFSDYKSPVMMGGDADSSSKCILGVCYLCDESGGDNSYNDNDVYLLVLDPHFSGMNATVQQLQDEQWISWKKLCDFDQNSFYNFCLPQIRGTECNLL